jgi:hypothetical protein
MRAIEQLEARTGVEQPHQARPAPAEVAREQERVVLAGDALGRVRTVDPVSEDAHERLLDRPELVDRLVGLGQELWDSHGLFAELSERPFQVHGRSLHVIGCKLVRLLPRISWPKYEHPVAHRRPPHGSAPKGTQGRC